MTAQPNNLLLAFYGDDFTGSTDALEFLSRAGAKTVLFIEPPTAEQLGRYEGLQAIGVAGMTRAMTPDKMELELRPAFTALRALGAAHVHYKVCSTFDSSPAIGSIGKAIDVAVEIFNAAFVPVLVAAPALGRYCAFGNLFARMGIGSQGKIYRLDRHPSMSKHPVTPADESDLRLHLGKQTTKQIGLLDIIEIAKNETGSKTALEKIINDRTEVVFFDAMYEEQLLKIGSLINSYASEQQPLFSVGSSGIEMALGNYWKQQGVLSEQVDWVAPGKAEAMLVISGSCSPISSGQIAWALDNGFAEIAMDTAAIAEGDSSTIEAHVAEALDMFAKGLHVIIHTSRGNDDERVDETKKAFAKLGLEEDVMRWKTAEIYGSALGKIARLVAERMSLQRIVIAGGDTSSYAARVMGIEAVEMIAPLSPGAPLCKAYAPGSSIDGLEVNFKGGQVGSEDYFGMVLNGG
jgi:uncharacterized protein YgbK (DUF1537 family)